MATGWSDMVCEPVDGPPLEFLGVLGEGTATNNLHQVAHTSSHRAGDPARPPRLYGARSTPQLKSNWIEPSSTVGMGGPVGL